jgi:hypothetical protein
VQGSRRQEHGTAHARGPGAQPASKLEARVLFAGSHGRACGRQYLHSAICALRTGSAKLSRMIFPDLHDPSAVEFPASWLAYCRWRVKVSGCWFAASASPAIRCCRHHRQRGARRSSRWRRRPADTRHRDRIASGLAVGERHEHNFVATRRIAIPRAVLAGARQPTLRYDLRIASASSTRPCVTSQRGDSGCDPLQKEKPRSTISSC